MDNNEFRKDWERRYWGVMIPLVMMVIIVAFILWIMGKLF